MVVDHSNATLVAVVASSGVVDESKGGALYSTIGYGSKKQCMYHIM